MNKQQEPISNLKFQEQSDTRLIYTYEEEGQNYKVIEDFSDDKKSVLSKIYIYDENEGAYKSEDEVFSTLDEKENTITQSFNGTEKVIQLEDIYQDEEISIVNDDFKSSIGLAAKKAPKWKHWQTYKSNSKIKMGYWCNSNRYCRYN